MAAKSSRASAKQPTKQQVKQQQPATVTAQRDSSSESEETLSPEELARALRAVAAELERDPALARRVAGAMRVPAPSPQPPLFDAPDEADSPVEESRARPTRRGKAFKPRLVTGAAPSLGQGIPDPFMLREELGEDGLRAALEDLRLGTLRAIVREHKLDPTGQLASQNDDAKFRALILRATKRAKRKG